MIVFSMLGQHLGDVVMAMPAAMDLTAQGHDVGIFVEKKYWTLFKDTPINLVTKFSRRDTYLRLDCDGREHQTDMWYRLAKLGKPVSRITIPFKENPHTAEMNEGKWFVLSPWVAGPKCWTAEGYAAVATHAAILGYRLAITGPDQAKELKDRISVLLNVPFLDLVGKETKNNWPDAYSKADIVLAPDTGSAHVADACGARTISLFGHVCSPHTYGPYWSRDLIVNHQHLGMSSILPKHVIPKLEEAHNGMD